MTLKDYIINLQEIEKEHPDALLVYSSDDEGNNYNEVNWGPSFGWFDGDSAFSVDKEDLSGNVTKVVCVN